LGEEPKPPWTGSNAEGLGRAVEERGVEFAGGFRDRAGGSKLGGHLAGGGDDLVATLLPGTLDAEQDAGEAGHASRVVRRVIRPAVERFEVGREEDRHRPAAVAGERLDRRHIEVIEVGAFFAIDLDIDISLVHERRDVRVLEALALHDVAPVARRIADRQEDRLVFRLRLRQGFGPPGEPVDRVVRVLEQIWAGFPRESVGGKS
jgi:hypothetical protein